MSKFAILERLESRHKQRITSIGFSMVFENGNTIFVEFENFDSSKSFSDSASIGIQNENGFWFEFIKDGTEEERTTLKDCSTEKVSDWIAKAMKLKF